VEYAPCPPQIVAYLLLYGSYDLLALRVGLFLSRSAQFCPLLLLITGSVLLPSLDLVLLVSILGPS
jgi:hypothetical protein